ncbi:MAG: hypothetical protein CMA63_07810 [Euryarchaeota archaeon]|nr:hypothetical protein [Euryarchaeota archaeon]|tara:strand:- start:24858 stop:25622 length:765 start_codon:yes stop_codon:yes gene_type:complete
MAGEQAGEAATVLMGEIEAVGPPLGLAMLLLSFFLMFYGFQKLKFIAAACGAGLGYVSTPLIYSVVGDSISEIPQVYFMAGIVVLFSLTLLFTVHITIAMTAFFCVFFSFSALFRWLVANGYDFVDNDYMAIILFTCSFFLTRLVRKYLPLLVSAVLGSMGCMAGMLLLNGDSLSLISAESSSTLLMLGVMITLSSVWQFKKMQYIAKQEKERETLNLPDIQHPKGAPHPNPGMIDKGPKRRRLGDLPDLRDFS